MRNNHRDSTQTLQQQTLRMAMQEEYMAQLTELQIELASTVDQMNRRLGGIEDELDRLSRAGGESEQATGNDAVAESEFIESVAPAESMLVVGRVEWVWLALLQRNLKARIETGALSSSLSATDLQPFERNGRDWIRFRVPDESHPDGGDIYEAPLVRYVRIRQASAERLERRPVVRLKVRLGDHVAEGDFSLTNREDMLYPVLLGRNFLRDVMLVDVAQRFTQPRYSPEGPMAPVQ